VDFEYLELRRKREEFSLEFRSIHRQAQLKKKRNTFNQPQNDIPFCDKLQTQLNFFAAKEFLLKDLPKLIDCSKSTDIIEQLYSCVGIRKLLSFGKNISYKP
jgi:hypothetical protein